MKTFTCGCPISATHHTCERLAGLTVLRTPPVVVLRCGLCTFSATTNDDAIALMRRHLRVDHRIKLSGD